LVDISITINSLFDPYLNFDKNVSSFRIKLQNNFYASKGTKHERRKCPMFVLFQCIFFNFFVLLYICFFFSILCLTDVLIGGKELSLQSLLSLSMNRLFTYMHKTVKVQLKLRYKTKTGVRQHKITCNIMIRWWSDSNTFPVCNNDHTKR